MFFVTCGSKRLADQPCLVHPSLKVHGLPWTIACLSVADQYARRCSLIALALQPRLRGMGAELNCLLQYSAESCQRQRALVIFIPGQHRSAMTAAPLDIHSMIA